MFLHVLELNTCALTCFLTPRIDASLFYYTSEQCIPNKETAQALLLTTVGERFKEQHPERFERMYLVAVSLTPELTRYLHDVVPSSLFFARPGNELSAILGMHQLCCRGDTQVVVRDPFKVGVSPSDVPLRKSPSRVHVVSLAILLLRLATFRLPRADVHSRCVPSLECVKSLFQVPVSPLSWSFESVSHDQLQYDILPGITQVKQLVQTPPLALNVFLFPSKIAVYVLNCEYLMLQLFGFKRFINIP